MTFRMFKYSVFQYSISMVNEMRNSLCTYKYASLFFFFLFFLNYIFVGDRKGALEISSNFALGTPECKRVLLTKVWQKQSEKVVFVQVVKNNFLTFYCGFSGLLGGFIRRLSCDLETVTVTKKIFSEKFIKIHTKATRIDCFFGKI